MIHFGAESKISMMERAIEESKIYRTCCIYLTKNLAIDPRRNPPSFIKVSDSPISPQANTPDEFAKGKRFQQFTTMLSHLIAPLIWSIGNVSDILFPLVICLSVNVRFVAAIAT